MGVPHRPSARGVADGRIARRVHGGGGAEEAARGGLTRTAVARERRLYARRAARRLRANDRPFPRQPAAAAPLVPHGHRPVVPDLRARHLPRRRAAPPPCVPRRLPASHGGLHLHRAARRAVARAQHLSPPRCTHRQLPRQAAGPLLARAHATRHGLQDPWRPALGLAPARYSGPAPLHRLGRPRGASAHLVAGGAALGHDLAHHAGQGPHRRHRRLRERRAEQPHLARCARAAARRHRV
mmetsp:Transcript_38185/g.96991  ORF Transcript_38185/g.96991 Transcript_38185/m.96991 type:complete len:240 (-) Transcript_38185:1973-2692(-)